MFIILPPFLLLLCPSFFSICPTSCSHVNQYLNMKINIYLSTYLSLYLSKVIMQESYFRDVRIFCTVVYCLLAVIVNTRRMSKPDMESIFHMKHQWNILVIGNYYVNYENFQNSMLLSSSDTKLTLMHLFLFTNSTQRELVSICTHSIRNCN